ncbi:MAG: TIGR03905 family TSCPD domain-containing protein [Clostridiales bacterium]|nr:TIGR03905 family TSCPD domain-containing protein [Clostridiales bacterium]
MHFVYKTQNVCSTSIEMDINDGVVTNVHFTGGCNGNLKCIPLLIDGMKADDIAKKISGVTCGNNTTSCGDQLAHAVLAAKQAELSANT